MLLGTLGVSLLGNKLAGNGIKKLWIQKIFTRGFLIPAPPSTNFEM